MSDVNFILLYVEDVARSADVLCPPARKAGRRDLRPISRCCRPAPGLMLGLWRRDGRRARRARRVPARREIAIASGRRRRRGGRPTRAGRRKARYRASADADGFRLHLRRARSRRPPHPRICARRAPEPRWTGVLLRLIFAAVALIARGRFLDDDDRSDRRSLQGPRGRLYRRHSRQRFQSQHRHVLPVADDGADHLQPRQVPAFPDHAGAGRAVSGDVLLPVRGAVAALPQARARAASSSPARRRRPISSIAAPTPTRPQELQLRVAILSDILYWKTLCLRVAFFICIACVLVAAPLLAIYAR